MNRNAQIRVNKRIHEMLIIMSKEEKRRQAEIAEEAIQTYINKRRSENEIVH